MDRKARTYLDAGWRWVKGINDLWSVSAMIGASGIAIWTCLKDTPGPVCAGIVLWVFASIPWMRYGWRRLRADNRDASLLLGLWSVQKSTEHEKDYVAVWKFLEDNTVIVKTTQYVRQGKWSLEPTRVLINWDEIQGIWDTFHRPLKPGGVLGDCWDGLNTVHAAKVTGG